MSNVETLTSKETTAMLRKALKAIYPGVKFSVRSDRSSMSSSVRISWEDGPTTKEVEEVANGYEGSSFDGMIDMRYNRDSWLAPDGRAYFAGTKGTTGSMGVVPPCEEPAPVKGCRRVRFCLDSVFCSRKYSRAAIDAVLSTLKGKGAPEGIYTVRGSDDWGYSIDTNASAHADWLYWRQEASKVMQAYHAEDDKKAA
ncbi:LPD29 domain-containing protein [Acetobacter malorum]|uniref:LPD29 domain-containing protein n=1 Tax=Acetobacter malorum TaxID=178901 RepID=UPI000777B03E|nr:LPD29 domain-containing protein [Acetobacter malorum]